MFFLQKKKGGFVFVDVAPADDTYKVQGQIAHVLNKDQIEYCKENDCCMCCVIWSDRQLII